MKVYVTCLEEGERETTFDGQKRRYYEASVRDTSPEGRRCTDNFTVRLNADQEAKFKGKLRDQSFNLQILRLRGGSGGTFTVEGEIEFIGNGKPASPAAK
jgi:hypothetical protein